MDPSHFYIIESSFHLFELGDEFIVWLILATAGSLAPKEGFGVRAGGGVDGDELRRAHAGRAAVGRAVHGLRVRIQRRGQRQVAVDVALLDHFSVMLVDIL